MKLSATVQAHPARREHAEALLPVLGGRAEITWDPCPDDFPPSPWRTYRHALETTPAWATHRLIVQDDVTLCQSFRETAERALTARPDRLVTFFVAGQPWEYANAVFRACEQDQPWAELGHSQWCPAIALAWPVETARAFLAYVEEQKWPAGFRADDEIIGRFTRGNRLSVLATVPSLVEHEDVIPSLIGRRTSGGADPGRVAACFIHPDCDPLAIDWA